MARHRQALRSRTGNRHRPIRSSVQGPYLPPIESKREQFYTVVADTAGYLVSRWPEELASVRLEVADLPTSELSPTSGQRWLADRTAERITLYRLPTSRSGIMRGLDPIHAQMLVEYTVFLAFAEYLGKEPWELAPDRYRPFP